MSKRWVTPSFEPSTATVATATEKRATSKKPKAKSSGGGGGDGRRRMPVTGSDSGSSVALKNSAVGVDLLSKYEPETPRDLVIHAKKIDQVRTWIHDRISNSGGNDGKFLLLHGPSGCGKSSTFRVLAKSLNVKIIEWITPLDRGEWSTDDWKNDNDDGDGDDYVRYFRASGGTGETFDNFLWRASRYNSLAGIENEAAPPALKVILVKDFPHSFVQNPQSFHDILKKYTNRNTYPVAFVCNDDLICRSLFPDDIRSECGVHDIAFNAVNCTAVTKALKRVLEMELRLNPELVSRLPDDVNLQAFHQQSAGDLRCAILKLYFTIIKPSSSPQPSQTEQMTVSATGGGAKGDGGEDDNSNTAVKDQHGSDLFRILGRILYCKTEPLTTPEPTHHAHARHAPDYKFTYDPDQLVKSMADRPAMLANFLQENYVSRFENVASIAAVADTFCAADVVLKHCYSSKETAAAADVIALSGVVRRLMVSNRRPKRSFAPFHKPRVYDRAETFAARFSRSIRKASPSHFHFSPSELVTHVLPFARVIPSMDVLQQHLKQFKSAGDGAGRVATFVA